METHGSSEVAMANFMDMMARRTVAIDEQLNKITHRQIQKNREKMRSIIKTVVFCGHNAMSLHGARVDNPDDETLQGNFKLCWLFVLTVETRHCKNT